MGSLLGPGRGSPDTRHETRRAVGDTPAALGLVRLLAGIPASAVARKAAFEADGRRFLLTCDPVTCM